MAAIPEPLHATSAAIYALHAARMATEDSRGYLGWSNLGSPCERALWLGFRWAAKENFDGRMARLFETGHREEARVIDELRAIGCKVWDRDEFGRQFGVSAHGGHLRGHADAVVLGLPEAPETPHLVDVKTINAKKFEELLKKGLRELFPRYWAQGQGYMGGLSLERAFFIFVCKDDDRIHCERFYFDPVEYQRLLARAERIITAPEPPPRISSDPAWWQCKTCAMHPLCHGDKAPEVNCRTCAHSTPEVDGDARWSCAHHRRDLTIEQQRTGCAGHRYIPILLERIGQQVDAWDDPDGNAAVRYRTPDGAEFVNGAPPHFSSVEIRAAKHKAMLADPQVQRIKADWPGARMVA